MLHSHTSGETVGTGPQTEGSDVVSWEERI